MKPVITVKFYPPLKELLGVASAEISASDVADALNVLAEKYGSRFSSEVMNPDGTIKNYYILFVGGRIIDQKNPSAVKLETGDLIEIYPPVAGG